MRLEVDAGDEPRLRDQLVEALKIDERQVYEVDGLLDLADLWDVVGIAGFSELRDPPLTPGSPSRGCAARTGEDADVFAAIREGDILVHHPYDSFADLGRALRPSRRSRTRTCSRSSRPSTGRAPTRRSSRR